MSTLRFFQGVYNEYHHIRSTPGWVQLEPEIYPIAIVMSTLNLPDVNHKPTLCQPSCELIPAFRLPKFNLFRYLLSSLNLLYIISEGIFSTSLDFQKPLGSCLSWQLPPGCASALPRTQSPWALPLRSKTPLGRSRRLSCSKPMAWGQTHCRDLNMIADVMVPYS